MFVAGMLAIISIAYAAPSQLQLVATTTTSHSQQSSFYTITTNLGAATVTEIIVNTEIQFPITGSTSESQTSNLFELAPLAFLLFMSAIAIGIRSARGT
jgi:hypothetical protein